MRNTNLRFALPFKTSLLPIVLLFLASACFAQSIPPASMYLGQQVPGITPKVFQLPVTPGLAAAERITITTDNKEIYYGELDNWPATSSRIKYYKYSGTSWQGPFVVFEGYVAPSLSPNDSIMYMQKNLNNNTLSCTFYSLRNGTGWTVPQRLLSMNRNTHYFQETNLKNYYTAGSPTSTGSATDLCNLYIRNGDTTLQNLGKPINTTATENDFFISRDESYIIFCRFIEGSASDLFISYKTDNGRWTNPKTLGPQVNTPNPNWEACPFVTKDNKYLFFMRGGNALSSYFIYWVAIDNLIDSLRQTNFTPYVRYTLQNQTFKTGRSNSFAISDSSFIDDNGNNTLTYTASLSNGNPLPSWLSFDPDSCSFIGTPTEAGSFYVKVTATDPAAASAMATFTLRVTDASGIDEQALEKSIQVFPNPARETVNLSFGTTGYKSAIISVTDQIGREIYTATIHNSQLATINLPGNPAGIYFLSLNIDGTLLRKKIILE
ncbi:MAG: putative Ig domain-containing protein [Bacteroidales bacterium]